MQSINYSRILFASGLALAMAGLSEPAAAGALIQQNITVGGVVRSFYISRPPGFSTAQKYPLMFVLHGGGGTGSQIATTTDMVSHADRLGFVAVFPNAINNQWNLGIDGNNDVTFINAVVDNQVSQGSVNSARVFAAGVSNGGVMTQRLACESNRFAAVAVFVANMPTNYVSRCHPLKQNIPTEFFFSTADPVMPYNGGPVKGSNRTVVSAAETVALWTNYAGCTGEQVLPIPDRVNDGTHVIRHTYTGCRVGAEAIFFEVVGGGHCWAGSRSGTPQTGICTANISGSAEVVHFFQAYGL